jgi:hypothetical protein
MNSANDSGQGTTPVTPRRRGAAPGEGPGVKPAEVPILLRLPDLHPSPQADAAVARLAQAQQGQRNRRSRSETGRPATDTPSEPREASSAPRSPRGSSRPADEAVRRESTRGTSSRSTFVNSSRQWSNRIIVIAFMATVVASGWMVFQRYQRDMAARQNSRSHSAERSLEPVPQLRIDRDSFQSEPDWPLPTVPEMATRPTESERVRVDVEAAPSGLPAPRYPAAPVTYEQVTADEWPAEYARPAALPASTPPVAAPPSTHDRIVPFVPRLLRVRDQHDTPSGDVLTAPHSFPSSQRSR